MSQQTVLILDFGGQYKELVARRVRECGVYSVVKPGELSVSEIEKIAPIGIIFTGGPASVYEESAPKCDKALFGLGIPVLGICYGAQLTAWMHGGEIASCEKGEYGRTHITVDPGSKLFEGLSPDQVALMSHTDRVTVLPEGFRTVAESDNCPNAAFENADKRVYAVQFHPETEGTLNGKQIIRNFLFNICGANGDYDL